MTTATRPAPIVNRPAADARLLLRALAHGPLPYSSLKHRCDGSTDRVIEAIDYALMREWIERRTQRMSFARQESDFLVTSLGKRIT